MGGSSHPGVSQGVNLKFNDARGWRLGAGMHLLMLSLNLEYQRIIYGSTALIQPGPFPTGTTFNGISFTDRGFVASVSLPLGL